MKTIKSIMAIAVVGAGLIATAGGETMFSSGPQDGRSGAPGEGLCTDCHSGTANSGSGSVSITGVPAGYSLNTTYSLTVTLSDPTQQRWGFELTAIDAAGDGAGAFTVTDAVNTQLSDNAAPARDYMKQTSTGTYAGTGGSASWQFDWTAPATDVGTVTFYVAGNAANNNGSTSGDLVYTASEESTLQAIRVPMITTWGLLVLVGIMLAGAAITLRRRRTNSAT